MVKQVVLIRVNLIVYPIDHIAVNHIALDSIPNARIFIATGLYVSYNKDSSQPTVIVF